MVRARSRSCCRAPDSTRAAFHSGAARLSHAGGARVLLPTRPAADAHACAPAGVKVYEWSQTIDEVNIYITPPEGARPRAHSMAELLELDT